MIESTHYVSWDRRLEQGVGAMDGDHREMIDLMNRVLRAYDRHRWDNSIEAAMFDFSYFTVKHFATEEQFMRDVGYPHCNVHTKAHQKLTVQLDAISDRITHDKAAAIDDGTVIYLHKWLTKHILHADHRLALYCQQNGLLCP